MGKPPAYDPVSETEYMVHANLADAEADEALYFLASTYDPERDRIVPGIGSRGPRILNFAPMLVREEFPLNDLVKALLERIGEDRQGQGRDRVRHHVARAAR